MLNAIDFYLGPDEQIVIAGDLQRQDAKDMIKIMSKKFLPRVVILFKDINAAAAIQWLDSYNAIDDRAAAYICQNYSCKKPVTDADEFDKMLEAAVNEFPGLK